MEEGLRSAMADFEGSTVEELNDWVFMVQSFAVIPAASVGGPGLADDFQEDVPAVKTKLTSRARREVTIHFWWRGNKCAQLTVFFQTGSP
jgi:hypothetical protein